LSDRRPSQLGSEHGGSGGAQGLSARATSSAARSRCARATANATSGRLAAAARPAGSRPGRPALSPWHSHNGWRHKRPARPRGSAAVVLRVEPSLRRDATRSKRPGDMSADEMPIIRLRRFAGRLPLVRAYELEISREGQAVDRARVRRGDAVRRLEQLVGVGDAWSFVSEADRVWADGDREVWAVEYEWPTQGR
jgi:hypothetical protein